MLENTYLIQTLNKKELFKKYQELKKELINPKLTISELFYISSQIHRLKQKLGLS